MTTEANGAPARDLEAPRRQEAELKLLSLKAEDGDGDARAELRRRVRECSPEKIAELADIARRAEGMLIKTIAAGEPLMREALEVRVRQMRAEVAGPMASPLEAMLASRVVSGWLLVEVLEALISAQYRRGANKAQRVGPDYILKMSKILESATRHHMQAVTTLARVRKLQANAPAVHLTQNNVG